MESFWTTCLSSLAKELPAQQLDLWVRSLLVLDRTPQGGAVELLAPNWTVMQWVQERYKSRIEELATSFYGRQVPVTLSLKNSTAEISKNEAFSSTGVENSSQITPPIATSSAAVELKLSGISAPLFYLQATPEAADKNKSEKSRLIRDFTFDNLVTGRANDLARAAAIQVASQPGTAYNPLFIYGGVGLGKTHILHAIGNHAMAIQPQLTARYVHSEDYFADVVRSYHQKSFDTFKSYYRSTDVLLIDDIQFFKGKDRTQEEFFFAFNALIDAKKQIVITCDTYPKDVQGLESRLISRFDWGLTVQIDPPELEMRIAILHKKATWEKINLPDDVAFLIAKNLRSNVRELEGALKKVMAYSNFHGTHISLDMCREALRDIFSAQNRQITVNLIQKTVADYYNIPLSEMRSKKRSRDVTRPRQTAMWLAKELTTLSLPSIGEFFGGRDHTTVLHAHRLISSLRQKDPRLGQDLHVLTQVLQG